MCTVVEMVAMLTCPGATLPTCCIKVKTSPIDSPSIGCRLEWVYLCVLYENFPLVNNVCLVVTCTLDYDARYVGKDVTLYVELNKHWVPYCFDFY